MDVNSLWILLPIGLSIVYIATLNRKKENPIVPIVLVKEELPVKLYPPSPPVPIMETWNWDIKGPPAPSRRPPVETSGMDVLTALPGYSSYSYPEYWKYDISLQTFYDIARIGPIAKPWISGDTDPFRMPIRF
jgi:hypothetical protein